MANKIKPVPIEEVKKYVLYVYRTMTNGYYAGREAFDTVEGPWWHRVEKRYYRDLVVNCLTNAIVYDSLAEAHAAMKVMEYSYSVKPLAVVERPVMHWTHP